MKALLLVLVLFPFAVSAQPNQLKDRIKQFHNHQKFKVERDRFTDTTRVSVGPFRINDGISSGLSIGVWFETPETVYFRVHVYGQRWAFLDDRFLYAIIDGERCELGNGQRDSGISRSGVTESLVFPLTREQFKQIANAKSVEMRIASKEFSLKAEHLQAFRDLLSLTT